MFDRRQRPAGAIGVAETVIVQRGKGRTQLSSHSSATPPDFERFKRRINNSVSLNLVCLR